MTERLHVPRAVFVPFRMGHHFGVPFHTRLQRRVIVEALTHVVEAKVSGEIRAIPISWAQARREGLELERVGNASR